MGKLFIFKSLFLCATLIVCNSCQKNPIPPSGHFTEFQIELKPSRSIASVASQDAQKLDPKQVYLNCYLKGQSEIESCFNEISKKLNLHSEFNKVQNEINEISTKIVQTLKASLEKRALKRNNFCKKNANYSFEKCLFQFFDKESIEITNIYQKKHNDLNGQEYLFIKGKVEERYKEILSKYHEKERKVELKKINKTIEKKFSLIEDKLLKKTDWIQENRFLPSCHKYCKNFAAKNLSKYISKSFQNELKDNPIIEEKCSDLLVHRKIISLINFNTNMAIENEISILSKKIGENTFIKSVECFQEKRIYDSEKQAKRTLEDCFHQSYQEERKIVLKTWREDLDGHSFFAQNSEIITKRITVPMVSLKRKIASRIESAPNL